MSLKLCEPSSIIKSKFLKLFLVNILSKHFKTLLLLLMSNPKTSIFSDLYLKFAILTSKQNTFILGRYFTKAAAEAPAKDPNSKMFICLLVISLKCFD